MSRAAQRMTAAITEVWRMMLRYRCVRRLSVLVAVCAAVGLALLLPHAARADDVPFMLQAVPDEASSTSGYFTLAARPGDSFDLKFSVSSNSAQALDLRVAAVDGQTAQFGGVAYTDSTVAPRSTGTWLTLSKKTIRVPAKSRKPLRARLMVPEDAAPGDHVAGVAVWIPTEKASASQVDEGQAGAVVNVVMRQVIAVHVVVAGPAEQHMEIADVQPIVQGNGVHLGIVQSNDGQLFTEGSGVITVAQDAFSYEFDLDKTVPGTSWTSPVLWALDPLDGTYDVEVVIDYDEDRKQAVWRGQIVIGDEVADEIRDRVIGSTRQAGFGWKWWLIIAAAAGCVAFLVWFSYQRGQRAQAR